MSNKTVAIRTHPMRRLGQLGEHLVGMRERLATLLGPKPLSRMEVRLPLIAAALIFLSAIGTAQFAVLWQSRDNAQQTALLGAVYLDNLSANIAPKVARRDVDGASLALRRTLNYHEGLRDEALFVLDRNGTLLAQAQRDGAPGASDIPSAARSKPAGTLEVASDGVAWVWRPLIYEGEAIGVLIAALDVAPLNAGRRNLSAYVLLAGLVVSIVVALAGIWVIRRYLRPVTAVTSHLEAVAAGQLNDIAEVKGESETLATLRKAFNQMVAATRERETMARRLAEQSRAAVLGRLAATIVHEVKNPLGGMQTAVETLKKYGDDRAVREESVGLIERGLETVEHVIDATLDSYKVPGKRRPLTMRDIDDVKTLIDAEARQRGIRFKSEIDIPKDTALPAVETRQVLLNLLLNACRATRQQGTVLFRAALGEDNARFEISDSGPGLDADTARAFETGGEAENDGLGLPIVRKLVDRLNGSIIAEDLKPHGTRLVVTLPLAPEDVAT